MKHFLIIVLLISTHSFAQEDCDIKDLADKLASVIQKQGMSDQLKDEDQKNLEQLHKKLFAEVVKEIEAEASLQKMTRDKYIDNEKSFNAFLSNIRTAVKTLDSLNQSDKLILTLKTGMRFGIQNEVRFEPKGHDERVKEVRKLSELMMNSLRKK